MAAPDKNKAFPLPHYNRLCFLKNIVKNPNIVVGDYTYYDDFEDVGNFENNVKYHFDFIGDKLFIGKFCMIASGVKFIMNGGNHQSNAISAYPFAIFGEDWSEAMKDKKYPSKGDTKVGNDVWIGHNATIMPGITIGDGAIIGTNSTVTKDVSPYSIVAGNPARQIKFRFEQEEIERLLALKWWDRDLKWITKNVQHLSGNKIEDLAR